MQVTRTDSSHGNRCWMFETLEINHNAFTIEFGRALAIFASSAFDMNTY